MWGVGAVLGVLVCGGRDAAAAAAAAARGGGCGRAKEDGWIIVKVIFNHTSRN